MVGTVLSLQGGEMKSVDSICGTVLEKNVRFWKVFGREYDKDKENNFL